MKRLIDSFAAPGKRLIAYLDVGDPGLAPREPADYVQIAHSCVEAGADVLELGVPFSDPFADGPVIAAASHRALAHGGGLDETLRVAAAIRRTSEVPIVLFGYANPLIVRGFAASARACRDAGIDALLVVDLPLSDDPEDAGAQLRAAAAAAGLGVVPLLAPTSSAARVEALRQVRAPFVYYVSVAGVTGAADVLVRADDPARRPLAEASARAHSLQLQLSLPVAIGFGIDNADKARIAAFGADGAGGARGVVVGSALVAALAAAPTQNARVAAVLEVLGPLRAALDPAP